MTRWATRLVIFVSLSLGLGLAQHAEDFVFGDARPDAPELASRGDYHVGVRTLELVNADQLDILNWSESDADPRYDRPLTVEIWYPAIIPEGAEERTEYQDVLGAQPGDPARPNTPFSMSGRALRDAEPDLSRGPYPLVIVSHGYPGSRYLLFYLAENLASKGYVVASIDHTESLRSDRAAFASTLLNRPLDVLFVLDEMAAYAEDDGSFLRGLVDADNTGLIGFSMGGYGVINAAGAGFSQAGVDQPWGVPGGLLAQRQHGNPDFEASQDARIRAVVALAPWGGALFFDEEGMAELQVPLFVFAGSHDDVSGYEDGVKLFFERAVNAERYLLTFLEARHNVAPVPPPAVTAEAPFDDYMHYAEPVWDRTRMNNIVQHFVTAFLGEQLKGEDHGAYLDLVEVASEGVWSQAEDGAFRDDHTHWAGFPNRTALGMEFRRADPEVP